MHAKGVLINGRHATMDADGKVASELWAGKEVGTKGVVNVPARSIVLCESSGKG
jgi:hypothetical protein